MEITTEQKLQIRELQYKANRLQQALLAIQNQMQAAVESMRTEAQLGTDVVFDLDSLSFKDKV